MNKQHILFIIVYCKFAWSSKAVYDPCLQCAEHVHFVQAIDSLEHSENNKWSIISFFIHCTMKSEIETSLRINKMHHKILTLFYGVGEYLFMIWCFRNCRSTDTNELYLICFKWLIRNVFPVMASLKFSKIPIIVPFPEKKSENNINFLKSYKRNILLKSRVNFVHLIVKHSWFTSCARRNKMFINDSHDIITNIGELSLNFLAIVLDPLSILLISSRLFLLLNRWQDSPWSSLRTDHILVTYR